MIGGTEDAQTCMSVTRTCGGDKQKEGGAKRKRKCNHYEEHGGEDVHERGGQGGGKNR